jgi:broad specificity phosphatase PhoE
MDKTRTALALSAAAALVACATAAPQPEPAFYVMRHLQKGIGEDPGLTEQGQSCAARVAEELSAAGIGVIFASRTRRAQETAAPTASRLGVIPLDYDPRDTPGLVARVRTEPGSVLVVGHSNTVPDIVEGLGGARPADLTEDRYGEIWRVARPSGAVTVRRIAC